MNQKEKAGCGCLARSGKNSNGCKVEFLVNVDERGQMVLPKVLREKANIKPGDKLAVIGWEKDDGALCCLLIKADSLLGGIQDFISSMMPTKTESK
jgi:antitoxin PrlF